tara:strand:+ start:943 stop:1194 length:252 start_codon:yes stop_codon:yes gene_type:complete
MMNNEMVDEKIVTCVTHFRMMERMMPTSGMLLEVKTQFADMAKGGDGGELGFTEKGETTCRGVNYKGMPDFFFQEVIDLMGWK